MAEEIVSRTHRVLNDLSLLIHVQQDRKHLLCQQRTDYGHEGDPLQRKPSLHSPHVCVKKNPESKHFASRICTAEEYMPAECR